MATAEGVYPKSNGDPSYASEYNAFNYVKNIQATVKTTQITCNTANGYVYWTAGTISLGATGYTLSASNSGADWRNSYIIATLSGGTATISNVAVGARSSLAGNTVVPLAFIDSAGLITHYFSNTKYTDEDASLATTAFGIGTTISKTIPIGGLNTGDALEVRAWGFASVGNNTGFVATLRINDGGNKDFTLWSRVNNNGTEYHDTTYIIQAAAQTRQDFTTAALGTAPTQSRSSSSTAITFTTINTISIVVTNGGSSSGGGEVSGFTITRIKA